MKEITRIHLAKTPYNIEIDARKILQKYLADIEKALQADDDTMTEIEARIVEMLTEGGVVGDKVIAVADVEVIKQKLGEPNEFIDEEDVSMSTRERRLMRDTSNGVIGGVLAGIAAYYSVNVIWLRLAAVILGIASFGTAFLLYLVLWIVMPATKTVADSLQLYGQKVTPAEIKRHIDTFTSEDKGAKPLVVVLRVLLGLMWVGGAIGALVALIFVAGVSWAQVFANELTPWMMVAFCAAALSGILLIIFCSIAAYASFAWRINKRIVTSLVVLAVAGIMVFSGAVIAGMYGSYEANRAIESRTYKSNVQLDSDFKNVRKLTVKGSDAQVRYVVRDGSPAMEVSAVDLVDERKTARVAIDGESAVLDVSATVKDCAQQAFFCDRGGVSVTIYGPALEAIDVQNNLSARYAAQSQNNISATVASNARFDVSEGRIDTVSVIIKHDGLVDLASGSVERVDAAVDYGADLQLGNIDTLSVVSPVSCPTDGGVNIDVDSLKTMISNGSEISAGNIASNCLSVAVGSEDTY